jgi:hypothetical protein
MGRLARTEREGIAAKWEEGLFTRRRLGRTSIDWLRWGLRFAQTAISEPVRESNQPGVAFESRLELAVFACIPTGPGPRVIAPSRIVWATSPSGRSRRRVPAVVDLPTVKELDAARRTLARLLRQFTATPGRAVPAVVPERSGPDRWSGLAARHFLALMSQFGSRLRRCQAPVPRADSAETMARCGRWFLPDRVTALYCSEPCLSLRTTRTSRERADVAIRSEKSRVRGGSKAAEKRQRPRSTAKEQQMRGGPQRKSQRQTGRG